MHPYNFLSLRPKETYLKRVASRNIIYHNWLCLETSDKKIRKHK